MSGPEDDAQPLSGWLGQMDPSAGDHPFKTPEVSRYEMGQILGWGGMGTIHAVEDRRLRREVAWKQGTDIRLPQEAWIAARLEHPGIVPIYDAGQDADGRPFYTMRLIRGRTLANALQATGSLADRLRLLRHFLATCQAIAYAHDVGVVHRDLKPANIMVGEFGETQVVDWGVARPMDMLATEEDEEAVIPTAHHAVTMAGAIVGTPAYMSPEQARGEDPDPRSDIWSLGVILYEIISGHPPFTGRDTDEVLDHVLHATIPTLTVDAPPDLIAIATRALNRDPTLRYVDAEQLAADVEAWLDGRQVFAHDYSAMELLIRFIQAWKVPLTAAGLATSVILVAITAATVRIDRARIVAEDAKIQLSSALQIADDQLANSLAAQSATALQRGSSSEAALLAARSLTINESAIARGVLAGTDGARVERLSVRPAPCSNASLSPSGRLAVCRRGDTMTLWDTDTGTVHLRLPRAPRFYSIDEDNRRLILTDIWDFVLHDLDTGEALQRFSPGEFLTLGDSRNGKTIVYGTNRAVVLDSVTGDRTSFKACLSSSINLPLVGDNRMVMACSDTTWEIHVDGHPIRYLAPLGTTTTTATGWLDNNHIFIGYKGTIAVVDIDQWKAVWSYPPQRGRVQSISTHSQMTAVTSDQMAPLLVSGGRTLRFPTGVRQLRAHGDAITTLGSEGVERWRLDDGAPNRFWHEAGISNIDVSPSGDLLSMATGSGVVEIRSPHGERQTTLQWQDRVVKAGTFSHDGNFFATSAVGAAEMRIYDTQTWRLYNKSPGIFRRIAPIGPSSFLAASWGQSHWVISASADKTLKLTNIFVGDMDATKDAIVVLASDAVWMVTDEESTKAFPLPDAQAIALSEDGRIAVADRSHISIRNVNGQILTQLDTEELTLDLDWSPDSQWIAAGTMSGLVEIWSVSNASVRAILHGHEERIVSVKFAPDGDNLYTGSWDGTTRRWSMRALNADPAQRLKDMEADLGRSVEEVMDKVF